MNKQTTAIMMLSVSMLLVFSIGGVSAYGPSTGISIIGGNSTTPIYTQKLFQPLIFLKSPGGRALFDDPYGIWANGNLSTRTSNYIFTGEQIEWRFLVWDKNGVPEKVGDVFAGWETRTNGPIDPQSQVECSYLGPVNGNLASIGYSNVRRPGDQEAQVTADPLTMGEYVCRLTITPSCTGAKWLGVKLIDIFGQNATMQEAEAWTCNPATDLSVSGHIDFGTLGPGEQGASTISITNNAQGGANIVLSISGKDFYDPTASGARCPDTNQLKLQGDGASFNTGFWYTAVQGSKSIGNKRIPYGTSVVDSDPVFSTGNGITKNWAGTHTLLTPGGSTSMTLHLGIPIPCVGQFTDGRIDLWALAV